MIDRMNFYGKRGVPFIFIIDFEMKKPLLIPVSEVNCHEILYDFNGFTNSTSDGKIKNFNRDISLLKKPIPYGIYEKAFNRVNSHEFNGDSYLLNLTFPTEISLNIDLKDIFTHSEAPYKLWYKNNFVVFSPESFVKISNNRIYSYPMKGTIDGSIENAEEKIISDEKEMAEHITIVDLIRNDLNSVAENAEVERFRYIDEIVTNDKRLLQVSSKISADLKENYAEQLGSIIYRLLPAGSICGAPKKKTVEIIKDVELDERGYYTGICGYFDGKNLDSGVMIRYIEKKGDRLFFRSGGGITIYSDLKKEYNEMVDKVYVPAGRINQNKE